MIYKSFFNHILFPIVEKLYGSSIKKKLNFLNRSQYFTAEEIEQYQSERLKLLIKHAYENVPYYKKLFDQNNIDPNKIQSIKDLKKLPILTKKIINDNREKLRSKNYENRSYPKFTSGSTGEPTKFYQTKEDFSNIWAGHFRAWSWAGYKLGDKYIKISMNDDRTKLIKKIQDKMFNCRYILINKLNESNIKKCIDIITKFNPKLIYGYSSSLNIISDYLIKNNIQLNVSAIITTGDNLIPSFRKKIEKSFNGRVYDEYGCGGEGLYISAQCEQGKYHINEELMIIENVNNEIIITSLFNYAMPLIRYKTGDLISIGEKCSCGRNLSVIKSIDGRDIDVIKTNHGDKLIVHFFAVLFEYLKGISTFKVIQNNIQGIVIQIVKNNLYNLKKDELEIRNYIQKTVGNDFKVEFEYVKDIPLEKNGKRKFIVSNI